MLEDGHRMFCDSFVRASGEAILGPQRELLEDAYRMFYDQFVFAPSAMRFMYVTRYFAIR
jgi:hypothetical protein